MDELSRSIWGHDTLGAPNYVEAHISQLRRKLREAGARRVIETVRGSGYRVRSVGAGQSPVGSVQAERLALPSEETTGYEERDAA